MRDTASLVLLVAGVAVVAAACVGALLVRDAYLRLHLLSPASSLGAPLVVAALAVQASPGRATVKLVVIGALLLAGGPVTTCAAARALAQQDGRVEEDSPR